MKRIFVSAAFAIVFSGLLAGIAAAEGVYGTVTAVDPRVDTFQIRPFEADPAAGPSIFIVRPAAQLQGIRSVEDLEPGDQVYVEAHPINPRAWSADVIARSV